MRVHLLLVLPLLLSGCARGCSGDDAIVDRPATTGPAAASETTSIESLKAAYDTIDRGVAAVEARAREVSSIETKLEDAARRFRAEIFSRIPREPRTDEVAARVERVAAAAGVEVLSLRQRPLGPPPAPLPTHYRGPGAYPFEEGHLLTHHVFDLRARGGAEAARVFAEKLREPGARLLCLGEAQVQDGTLSARLEAYSFPALRPPTPSLEPPSRAVVFDQLGLPQAPPCGSDPACAELLARIDKRLEAIKAVRTRAETAQAMLGELLLWQARSARVQKLLKECAARL